MFLLEARAIKCLWAFFFKIPIEWLGDVPYIKACSINQSIGSVLISEGPTLVAAAQRHMDG